MDSKFLAIASIVSPLFIIACGSSNKSSPSSNDGGNTPTPDAGNTNVDASGAFSCQTIPPQTLDGGVALAGDSCIDFAVGTPQAEASEYCTYFGGTFSTTSICPTANRVGSCTATDEGITSTVRFYQPSTSTEATDACVQYSGTYTPN